MKRKNENIYRPFKAKIKEVGKTHGDIKMFKAVPEQKRDYSPGQFFMVSKWGVGEVPISVTSTRELHSHLEFGIKKVGMVTAALHTLKKGDILWLRGPYGNGFSTDMAKKGDVLFIAGGIGIVPLRSLINCVLAKKRKHGRTVLIYGSKNPDEILFKEDLRAWGRRGLETILTVDNVDKTWKGRFGLVTEYIDEPEVDFKKACSYICGPDVMIKKTMKELSFRDMPDSRIVTTLEARMKCGVGKCGQCYSGTEYICSNGPVYTYEEIKKRKVYGP